MPQIRTQEKRQKLNATARKKLADLNATLLKEGQKKCQQCFTVHDLDKFKTPTHVMCIECSNTQSKARREKASDIKKSNVIRDDGLKTCIGCKKTHDLDKFKTPTHVRCIDCEKIQKDRINDIKEHNVNRIDGMKKCLRCKKTHELEQFTTLDHKLCIDCLDTQKDRINYIKEHNATRTDGLKTCTKCKNTKSPNDFTGSNALCNTCCDKREVYRNNARTKYSRYQRDAAKRNIPFDLTIEECTVLFNRDCHQCGVSVKDNNGKLNGIDRMNNNAAYTLPNCASCCCGCNCMKHALDPKTVSYRALHCRSIRLGTDGQLFSDAWEDRLPGPYWKYKSSAKQNSIAFEMTKDQYTALTNTPCCECQRPITATNKSGIDRIDPTEGYVDGNLQALCSECNFMKGEMQNDDYIEHMDRIAAHAEVTIAKTPDEIPTCLRYFAPNAFKRRKKDT